jgi:hypothetical protein
VPTSVLASALRLVRPILELHIGSVCTFLGVNSCDCFHRSEKTFDNIQHPFVLKIPQGVKKVSMKSYKLTFPKRFLGLGLSM